MPPLKVFLLNKNETLAKANFTNFTKWKIKFEKSFLPSLSIFRGNNNNSILSNRLLLLFTTRWLEREREKRDREGCLANNELSLSLSLKKRGSSRLTPSPFFSFANGQVASLLVWYTRIQERVDSEKVREKN